MHGEGKRLLKGDGLRFLAAGIANTGLTLVVYQLLLFVVSPAHSYIVAWVTGLAFVAIIYPNKVFKGGRRTVIDRLSLAGCYCAVFLSGLFFLRVLQEQGVVPRLAILMVIVATTLLNFVLSRALLRR
ncbi:GtrA family protein [Aureimonas fodinaquatilis]|nr:GtrA family protein [Aureimonas fodinaquatilis]